MPFRRERNKWIGRLLVTALVILLTGCGSESEKTVEANALIQQMDYEAALKKLEEARSEGENIRLIERSRGIAYMGLTDYEAAIEAFRASLKASDGWVQNLDYDTNYYLAAALTKNGNYAEAEQVYNAILELSPEEKDAYFLRGNVRLNLNQYESAVKDLDQVLMMEPHNYDRLIAVYEVLDCFGYREIGQTYLRTALESDSGQMDNYVIGRIYYYLGEYQKACMALEEARNKQDAPAFLYLGKAYEATGDFNYAASVYNSYLAKYGENAEIYNQLGLCEMARGEYAKALEYFQAGLGLEENNVLQNLAFNEIVAYEYLGDFKQAYALMGQYLQFYPDDEEAKREFDFLSTR